MNKPLIVTLCGSTRFRRAFEIANRELTLKGVAVFTVGAFPHADKDFDITPEQKSKVDILHFQKIEASDEVFVLDVGGYIGESTRREIDFARAADKTVIFFREAVSLIDNHIAARYGWSRAYEKEMSVDCSQPIEKLLRLKEEG